MRDITEYRIVYEPPRNRLLFPDLPERFKIVETNTYDYIDVHISVSTRTTSKVVFRCDTKAEALKKLSLIKRYNSHDKQD